MYIIRVRTDDGYLYWSNEHGWTNSVDDRTYFTDAERWQLSLPMWDGPRAAEPPSLIGLVQWVPVF